MIRQTEEENRITKKWGFTTLKELCHGNFQVFYLNCLQLEQSTFVVHEILIEH